MDLETNGAENNALLPGLGNFLKLEDNEVDSREPKLSSTVLTVEPEAEQPADSFMEEMPLQKFGGLEGEVAPTLTPVDPPQDQGTPAPVQQQQSSAKAVEKQKKPKKRKSNVDPNSPRSSVSGYQLFFSSRMRAMKEEDPSLGFVDLTRAIAAEWKVMPPEDKQHYQATADEDKRRYEAEMLSYRKTETYRKFQEQKRKEDQQNKARKVTEKVASEQAEREQDAGDDLSVPIFTPEFLEHNRARESELRRLRRQAIELEEQNAALARSAEQAEAAVTQLQEELGVQQASNTELEDQLSSLRRALSQAFAKFPLPGTTEYPSLETIDDYLFKLRAHLQEGSEANGRLLTTVRKLLSTAQL